MGCIHVRHQSVWGPIWLKERAVANRAVVIYLVLIAVDEVEVDVAVQLLHHLVERKWSQRVVAVHKRDELASCFLDTCVCAGRDAAI